MGEIAPSGHSRQPQTGAAIDDAQTAWTIAIVDETATAHREAVETIVAKTEATHSEQVLYYTAPFVDEAIRNLGRRLLEQQNRKITKVERIADEYHRRSQLLG